MTQTAELKYTAGTIKNPQHTKSTEAAFTDTTLVHFPDGKLTPIPAFVASAVSGATITGTVRSAWAQVLRTANYTGGHYLFGSSYGLYAEYGGVRRNVTPLKTTEEDTLGTDPLAVVDETDVITVTYTAHGLAAGDRIKLTGATTTGGIDAANINKEHVVVAIPTADTFTIAVGADATSTTTGGGSSIDLFYQIAPGNEYQVYASGYGAGTYGTGAYGASQTSTSTFLFPRIWSFDNFGNGFVICPGDYATGDGQKIYSWAGNYTVAPAVMTDAPTDCQFVFVVNNRIIALCGTKIKIAGLDSVLAPIWSGYGYNEFSVQGSTLLLSGFKVGDKSAIIFAPAPYLLTFNGSVPDLQELGEEYSIVAPMAACRLEDGLIWYAANGNFYFYNGSSVQTISNNQNGEYIRDAINPGAIWTTFMMADQKHNQAWMYFPTGSNQNPNEYLIINPGRYKGATGFSFILGEQTRTAAQRPLPILTRFYMFDAATQYTAFTNQAVTSPWSAKTSAFWVDGDNSARLVSVRPDFFQGAPINLTIYGLSGPQGAESVFGPYEITSSAVRVTAPASGNMFMFEFSGEGDAMIGGMKIDFNTRGGRRR
jgi:hypothetical protein